jgi:hypothetical protein
MKPMEPHLPACIYKWENRLASGIELPVAEIHPSEILRTVQGMSFDDKADILAGVVPPPFQPLDPPREVVTELQEWEGLDSGDDDPAESRPGSDPSLIKPEPDFTRFISTPPWEKYPEGPVELPQGPNAGQVINPTPVDIRKGVQQIAENLSNIFSPKVLIQGRARTQADYTIPPTPENKEDSMTAGDLTPLGRGEVPDDVLSSRRWSFSTEVPATKAATRVAGEILPDAARLFVKRNRDYGDGANELGLMGQYADINRKVKKLKRILWDGIEPVGESAEEIALDLIGHLGLTIDMLRLEEQKRAAQQHLKAPLTEKDF